MPDDEPQQFDPLDDTTYGTFNPDMRLQARLTALDAAVRSTTGTAAGHDADFVLVRAETFERWLLRGDRPTA